MVSNFSVDSAVATVRDTSSIIPLTANSYSSASPASGSSSIALIFISYYQYVNICVISYIFLFVDSA